MKFIILIISSFLLVNTAIAQNNDEPLMKEYQKRFKSKYFNFGAVLQFVFDYQGARTEAGSNGFSIANMRLQMNGNFDAGFGYFLQTKFDKSPGILDAYITYRLARAFNVQFGQFKAPFSKELLIGAPNIDFVNRSRVVSTLAPGRQIGIQFDGFVFNELLQFQAGLFNGNGTASNNNDNNNFLYAARLAVFPAWFESDYGKGLEFGLNAAYSKDERLNLLNGALNEFSGERMLGGSDLRINYNNLLFAGEYVFANLDADSGQTIKPGGFQVTAGYRLRPDVQLLLRWDQLNLDQAVSDGQNYKDRLVFGINFWPTSITELQLNYIVNPDARELKRHQILLNGQIVF